MKPSLFLHPMARHGKIVSVSCVDKRKEIAWMIIQWQIMIVSFLYSFYLIFKIFYIVEIIFFVIIRILFKYIGIQRFNPLSHCWLMKKHSSHVHLYFDDYVCSLFTLVHMSDGYIWYMFEFPTYEMAWHFFCKINQFRVSIRKSEEMCVM